MEQESRHPENAQLPGKVAQAVDAFFHAIADEDQCLDFFLPGLLDGLPQDFFDLCMAAAAGHAAHASKQRIGRAQPWARLELAIAAVVAKLDVQSAQCRGLAEHVALQLAGPVPGRLAAGGGVHSEDQAAALLPGLDRRQRTHLFDESVDRSLARFLWKIFVNTCHESVF